MRNNKGYYGKFGGQFVPEILLKPLNQFEEAFEAAILDKAFLQEFDDLLQNYAGRPTPLTLCRNISPNANVKIYLKREDLLHGGAHKINQVLGQALLAKRMGKTAIIAETGAGQHGTATALACALLGLRCRVYMGAKDCERQRPNVFRMRLMGAKVIPVRNGSRTLKDACSEALRDWTENYGSSHYLLGTAAGPHPFPYIVKYFQKVIGMEVKRQILNREKRLPDAIIACVGGGSNAIGIFAEFLQNSSVKLIGVEPAGKGLNTNKHGAPMFKGKEGIFFGMKSLLMQDTYGNIEESYSISAGLDFPSVGPEHAYLQDIKRAQYHTITDAEALEAFHLLSKTEGIIPALESAHALAYALKYAKTCKKNTLLVVNLSGRGDKDIFTIQEIFKKQGRMI